MEPDEPIEKEWKRASGSWVDFVRSGKDFYREYMNARASPLYYVWKNSHIILVVPEDSGVKGAPLRKCLSYYNATFRPLSLGFLKGYPMNEPILFKPRPLQTCARAHFQHLLY